MAAVAQAHLHLLLNRLLHQLFSRATEFQGANAGIPQILVLGIDDRCRGVSSPCFPSLKRSNSPATTQKKKTPCTSSFAVQLGPACEGSRGRKRLSNGLHLGNVKIIQNMSNGMNGYPNPANFTRHMMSNHHLSCGQPI